MEASNKNDATVVAATAIPSAVCLRSERPRCTYNGPHNQLPQFANHCSCRVYPTNPEQLLCGWEESRYTDICSHPSVKPIDVALHEVERVQRDIDITKRYLKAQERELYDSEDALYTLRQKLRKQQQQEQTPS